jgi:hypothetical protein
MKPKIRKYLSASSNISSARGMYKSTGVRVTD